MQAGFRVAIAGLQSRPELNQCFATLLSWHSASSRWGVKVEGSEEAIRIKPANLALTSLDQAKEVGVAIWDAAKDGNVARLSMLLMSVPPGPWGDVTDEDGSSALSAAAACANLRCVALLLYLPQSSTVDLANKLGQTPVHRAAEGGGAEVLQLLLTARGCPNAPDSEGQPPLCYAAEAGRTECVRVLLHAGASPSAEYRGATPYQWALFGGHMECAALLQRFAAGGNGLLENKPKHSAAATGATDEERDAAGTQTVEPASRAARMRHAQCEALAAAFLEQQEKEQQHG